MYVYIYIYIERERDQGLWPMEWPQCGGGGEIMMTIDDNEMFERTFILVFRFAFFFINTSLLQLEWF